MQGQVFGSETTLLTNQQMPTHTHAVNATSGTGNANSPAQTYWAEGQKQFSTNVSDGTMNQQSITSIGGNQPHNNMMPFLTINYIIALEGIFPSQT
ncbi:hypothetical protein D3C76_1385330 [compost metagenome]